MAENKKVKALDPVELHDEAMSIRMKAMEVGPKGAIDFDVTKPKVSLDNVDQNDIVDMESLEMVTKTDFDFTDLLEEEREYVWPNIRKIVKDNFRWDVEVFPKEYLTNKKFKIRRLNMNDQEAVNKELRKARAYIMASGGTPEQGDFDNTAYMMERAIIPHMEAKVFKKLPTVAFLYLSSCFTDAQGFHRDTFNTFRREQAAASTA